MPPKTVANAMHGKVFIITGSSSGIGRATAILLASWGSRLTVHGRHVERVEETAKECKKVSPSGQDACTVIGNIEDPEIRKQLIQMTLNTFGRIDGLVSSAGHCAVGGWEHEDVKAMKLMLDVHVVAPYDLCRQMMPELIKNKGSIVMVSSIASLRGVPKLVANTTAKHAMDGMMKALAVETAKQGVRINSVNPGIVKSNTHRCGALDEYQKRLNAGKVHPNGRIGELREVAACVAFLLSPAASMVTGVSLPVDGGLTCAAMWQY